jgi:hypothetical protein
LKFLKKIAQGATAMPELMDGNGVDRVIERLQSSFLGAV